MIIVAINWGRNVVRNASSAPITPLACRAIVVVLRILTKIKRAIIIRAINAVVAIVAGVAFHRIRRRLNRASGTHGAKNEKNAQNHERASSHHLFSHLVLLCRPQLFSVGRFFALLGAFFIFKILKISYYLSKK
jgi:hypothetical protein